jgi:hypothetical protein
MAADPVEMSALSITPGAGRGCTLNRCVPGKRLRNWHRRRNAGLSLLAFARGIAKGHIESCGPDAARVAKLWLANKGARP